MDTLVFLEQEKYEKAMESFLKIKNKNYKSIVVEKIPNKGFGEAINDRLKNNNILRFY